MARPPRRPESVPRAEIVIGHGRRPMGHRIIRLLLTIWLVGYPVVACGPMLVGAFAGGKSGGAVAVGGLVAGGLLLGPWLIGILILGLLAVLTR
jgi:hypothetical protein